MSFFNEEILKGISKVPATPSPGSLIVTKSAKPVFAYKHSGDIFFATCEYGSSLISFKLC